MSGLLKRQKTRDTLVKEATQDIYKQFMIDMMCLTLNDPEYVGKDRFGYDRLVKVCEGVLKNCQTYQIALTKHENADYARSKLDQEMVRIAKDPDRVTPFEQRYPWIYKIVYGKK